MPTSPHDSLDYLIIGAGVIGLAIARALALSGQRVAVMEQESQPGQHASTRNSGVIHAGLYYPATSLKTRLCVRGNALLYQYCASNQIAHRRCGKLVLAGDRQQLDALQALYQQAQKNGVAELEWLSQDALHNREPAVRAVAALFSGSSGIIDTAALIDALVRDLLDADGILALGNRFISARCDDRGFEVTVRNHQVNHSLHCRTLINAAGLYSTDVAHQIDDMPAALVPEMRYARGNYFRLHGAPPISHLLYPLPEQHGLGIHATLDMAGEVRMGPDVDWVATPDYRVNLEHKPRFVEAAQRLLPSIQADQLQPDYAGVRCKAFYRDQPVSDFIVQTRATHGVKGLINLFGFESPGLTSALALAELLTAQLAGGAQA